MARHLMAKGQALLLAVIITLALLGWIAVSTDWREMLAILRDANIALMLMAAVLALPVQWLRARRFKLMLALADEQDWPMFRVAGLLVVFNTLIPFRLGELSFPLLVSRAFGVGKAYALGVLTFVRMFDLALVILLLSLFGFLTLPSAIFKTLVMVMASGAILAMFALLFFARALRSWILGISGSGKLSALVNNLAQGAAALGSGHRLLFVTYSLAVWLILGVMSTMAAMAVIPSIVIIDGLFAAAASNIAFALPVNGIASLGPAQIAWAEALRLNEYDYALAIASALAVHLTILLGIALTALLITVRR